jgi:hypothetical protein
LLYAAKSSPETKLRIKKIIDKNHMGPLDAKKLLKLCFDTEAFEYIRTLTKKNEAEAALLLESLKSNVARQALVLINRVAYERVDRLCF